MNDIRFGAFCGAAAALVLAGSPQPVFASVTLYDVQFDGASAYTGPAIIGSTGDLWNNITTANATTTLVDATGASSTVQLTDGGSATYNTGNASGGSGFFGTTDAGLMEGYIHTSTSAATMTFTGLPDNTLYDLYIYSQGDYNHGGREMTVTYEGDNYTTAAGNAHASTFVLNQNYEEISVESTATGTLSFTYVQAAGEADINGLQLQEVPEPGPARWTGLTFAAVGAVSLIKRWRRPTPVS